MLSSRSIRERETKRCDKRADDVAPMHSQRRHELAARAGKNCQSFFRLLAEPAAAAHEFLVQGSLVGDRPAKEDTAEVEKRPGKLREADTRRRRDAWFS